jgi:hypothetical protein
VNRVLWWLGEIIGGVLLGGVVMGIVAPAARRLDVPLGPWVVWGVLALSVAATIVAVERSRKGRAKS